MPDKILPQLREQTAQAHTSLEECVGIEQAVRDTARYQALLEQFYGFYAPMEERLHLVQGWPGAYQPSERHKAAWLAADLGTLGLAPAAISALPRCGELPELADLSTAYGAAYVLEGATLGGRQISAMLAEGPVPPLARTFFASYGPATGTKWEEFCTALEDFAEEGADKSLIIAGAEATFSAMEKWLCSREEVVA